MLKIEFKMESMSWTNYHGHCDYCDGHGKIEEYIQSAIKIGMPIIGISSHAPVPFDCFWTMKNERIENYLSELKVIKEIYKGQIDILSSLEIDYIPNITGPDSFNNHIAELDYKVGSIHFVDQFKNGEHWAIDGSFVDFKKGVDEIFKGDVKAAVQRFYHLTREMITTQSFDIIGHFDKIKMHNITQQMFDVNEQWYVDEVESVLDLIASKGIVVEINTKSYERDGMLFPGEDLFYKLHKKGIKVTINSDAHFPDKLISGFNYVAEKLLYAGFEYVSEYKDAKWENFKFAKDGIIWE
jgi:histidinol-phosphatase (PHP family)